MITSKNGKKTPCSVSIASLNLHQFVCRLHGDHHTKKYEIHSPLRLDHCQPRKMSDHRHFLTINSSTQIGKDRMVERDND